MCTREAEPAPAVTPPPTAARAKAASTEGTGLPATGDFPDGAGGFDFAISRAAAQTACTGAGHAFAEGADDDTRTCNHPLKPVGFHATLELGFCADALCRIDILTRAEADTSWTQRFLELRAALEERYGRPTTTKSVLPQGVRLHAVRVPRTRHRGLLGHLEVVVARGHHAGDGKAGGPAGHPRIVRATGSAAASCALTSCGPSHPRGTPSMLSASTW